MTPRSAARSTKQATRSREAHHVMSTVTSSGHETTVLHVGGLQYATQGEVVEHALGARPGVVAVDANAIAQTAPTTCDPARPSVADLQRWLEECGMHCAARSVQGHICDPMAEIGVPPAGM